VEPGVSGPSDAPAALTQTELRALAEYARGRSLSEIAASMFLSERSVRRRLRVAREAFGVETTIEAVVIAVRRGFL
jgi:DNA-binding CsgD family transcriptional regulator